MSSACKALRGCGPERSRSRKLSPKTRLHQISTRGWWHPFKAAGAIDGHVIRRGLAVVLVDSKFPCASGWSPSIQQATSCGAFTVEILLAAPCGRLASLEFRQCDARKRESGRICTSAGRLSICRSRRHSPVCRSTIAGTGSARRGASNFATIRARFPYRFQLRIGTVQPSPPSLGLIGQIAHRGKDQGDLFRVMPDIGASSAT